MIDIRTRYLSDEDAARLYASHPDVGRSYATYCPTCKKKGTYRWQGKDHACDCEEQLQLLKHYLAAGIGIQYQRLGWSDLKSDEIVAQLRGYVDNPEYVQRGRGLILTGDLGTGKTMLATLILKRLVREGHTCFATTFSDMIEMFTAGWYDEDQRRYFHRKVVESRVLLLDDVGRDQKHRNALNESTFDSVLRTRVQHGRATIITTNMTLDELSRGYGGAVLRLLREKSEAFEITGVDFSAKAKQREDGEIARGEQRPIL